MLLWKFCDWDIHLNLLYFFMKVKDKAKPNKSK